MQATVWQDGRDQCTKWKLIIIKKLYFIFIFGRGRSHIMVNQVKEI